MYGKMVARSSASTGEKTASALTPLTWAHVAMHGEFQLNVNSRLDLGRHHVLLRRASYGE
jgi:hypothetical protein